MEVSFIGLGVMGRNMAMNIAKCGELILVSDMVETAFPFFMKKGIKTSTSNVDAADADIIFLSLPSTNIVKIVLESLLPHLHSGQTIVDLSTIGYNATIEFHKMFGAIGVEFLDAPVSGMESRAADGTLTIMAGGQKSVFDKVYPYFELIGNKILFMGKEGAGQLTKLINQLLFDINVAALAEILPMSVKMGLDSTKVGEVINSGTGRSFASQQFIPGILKRDFHNGYAMKHAYKDLISASEIGANTGIPMPVLAAATSTYQMALLKGLGDGDKGSMVKVFEDLLGVQFIEKSEV